MTSREEKPLRTRAAILQAAAVEFDARGYAAVSISEIAERLGLTKGTGDLPPPLGPGGPRRTRRLDVGPPPPRAAGLLNRTERRPRDDLRTVRRPRGKDPVQTWLH